MNSPLNANPRRGMTLVELMMGLAITSLIAAASVAVAMAASNAEAQSQQFAETLHAGRSGAERLQRLIRGARLVVACSDTEMVLWTQDTDDIGKINAEEVITIRFDEQAGELIQTRLVLPEWLSEQSRMLLNPTLELDAISSAALAERSIGSAQYRIRQPLAVDVERVQFTPDQVAPMSRAIAVAMTFAGQTSRFEIESAVALRAPATERLQRDEQGYVLLEGVSSDSTSAGDTGSDVDGGGSANDDGDGSGNNGNGNGGGNGNNNGNGNGGGNGNNGNGNAYGHDDDHTGRGGGNGNGRNR